ncbi:MAG: tandem-95 repeat protein [Pirellulaceae bacterium]
MSGQNDRRGQKRVRACDRGEQLRQQKRRFGQMLQVESLERRELFAADLSPHQNLIFAPDVTRDFRVTPLDALYVVNSLNSEGPRSLDPNFDRNSGQPLMDVSGDMLLTPMDALMVVNALNRGEGLGEIVELKYEIVDMNGALLPDPIPGNGVADYQASVGSQFKLRVLARDARAIDPLGLYNVAHDVLIANQNGITSEIVELEWAEVDLLRISTPPKETGKVWVYQQGTFSIQFGSGPDARKTAPIEMPISTAGALNKTELAARIQTAVANLPGVGANNVRVESVARLDSSTQAFTHYNITFINDLARTNFPDPIMVDASGTFVERNSNVTAPMNFSISGYPNPDPSNTSQVTLAAFDFKMKTPTGAAQPVQYDQFPQAFYVGVNPTTYKLRDTSAGLNGLSLPAGVDPSAFYRIWEATFTAGKEGTVFFTGEGATTSEMLLIGENEKVDPSIISFPRNVMLKVVKNLTANDDTFPISGQPAILEDQGPTILPVTANDTTVLTGVPFFIQSVTQPSGGGGTVSFAANGTNVTFTPAPNFSGVTTFTYTITNALGDTSTATVTLTVTPVNDAPTVIKDTFSTNEDTAISILATEIFSPGPGEGSQTFTSVVATPIAGQTFGTVSVVSGSIIYTPEANFNGTARFLAQVTDSGTPPQTVSTTVTINVAPVNDAPIPFTGPITSEEDVPLTLIGTGAANDLLSRSQPGPSNESNQTLTLLSIDPTTEKGGTITLSNGVYRYQPPANYNGQDFFNYTILDNGTPPAEATGRVTLNITPVNDGPIVVDDTGSARFVAVGLTGLTSNFDPLANDSPGPDAGDELVIVAVGTPSQGGTVTIAADGKSINYTPAPGAVNLEDTFTYTVRDKGGLEAIGNIAVFVIPPTLPFAVDDVRTIDEDSAGIDINVMLNDFINAGESKQILSFTQPSHGTVTLDNKGTADTSDDTLFYVPGADQTQRVVFEYTMIDGKVGSESSTATVTVNIREVNDGPTVIDHTYTTPEDTIFTMPSSNLLNGSSAGPNESSQTLTVISVQAQTTGAGTIQLIGNEVRYSPSQDYVGQFIYTYTVQDNGTTGGAADPKQALGTVTINVTEVNDPPVVGNDQVNATEDMEARYAIGLYAGFDQAGSFGLMANDRPGPETAISERDQTITFKSFSETTDRGGTVVRDGNDLVYTPPANFFGQDSFTYSIEDNGVPPLTGSGTVFITVAPVNDGPIAQDINRIAYKNLVREFDVNAEVATFSPGPGESSQVVTLAGVTSQTTAQGGSITFNPVTKLLRYVPPADYVGPDSFEFIVTDNGTPALTDTATFFIDVKPFVPSVIQGFVWTDDNYDGKVGDRETRLGGVKVVLTGRVVGESTDITPVEELTMGDGSYDFRDLAPGTYTVRIVSPTLITDGADHAGPMGDLDGIANQFTIQIDPPGDVIACDYNFAMIGVEPGYANIVENLASSFYGRYPGIQQKGFYAAVDAAGRPLWSSMKDGFDGTVFSEVVIGANGQDVYLTRVDAAQNVQTALVPRNRNVRVTDSAGNRLVRILATQEDLSWETINMAAPPMKSPYYLSSVDQVFDQDEWDDFN